MSNFLKNITVLVVFCVLTLTGFAHGQEKERKSCHLCGMYLDIYAATRHVVVYEDGTQMETCSLACAAKLYKGSDKKVTKIMAADYLTHELIDAQTAFYLEGSDVPGVMSYTSRIAFKTKADALEFQKKHGGTIIPFQEALKNQIEKR